MYRVIYARNIAVPLQNRTLFREQLQAVIDAGDVSADNRLQNLLAKRRARRYLSQIDDLFLPDEPGTPAATPDAPAGEASSQN